MTTVHVQVPDCFVDVLTRNGLVTIPAIRSATPGLVVHGRLLYDGTAVERGEWVVTHAASGRCLSLAVTSKKNALTVARSLGHIDWEARDTKSIMSDRYLAGVVRDAYALVQL